MLVKEEWCFSLFSVNLSDEADFLFIKSLTDATTCYLRIFVSDYFLLPSAVQKRAGIQLMIFHAGDKIVTISVTCILI